MVWNLLFVHEHTHPKRRNGIDRKNNRETDTETESEREEIFVEVYTKSDWYEQSTSTV